MTQLLGTRLPAARPAALLEPTLQPTRLSDVLFSPVPRHQLSPSIATISAGYFLSHKIQNTQNKTIDRQGKEWREGGVGRRREHVKNPSSCASNRCGSQVVFDVGFFFLSFNDYGASEPGPKKMIKSSL